MTIALIDPTTPVPPVIQHLVDIYDVEPTLCEGVCWISPVGKPPRACGEDYEATHQSPVAYEERIFNLRPFLGISLPIQLDGRQFKGRFDLTIGDEIFTDQLVATGTLITPPGQPNQFLHGLHVIAPIPAISP